MKTGDGLNVEAVWAYMLWYFLIGFIGVIRSPESLKLQQNLWYVKIYKYINFIPISFIILHNEHYISVFISNEYIYYYDSLGKNPSTNYLKYIQQFANDLRNKPMPFKYNKIKYQNRSGNCGYFAIKYLFSQYWNKLHLDWNTKKDHSIDGEIMIENFKRSVWYRILFWINYSLLVPLFLSSIIIHGILEIWRRNSIFPRYYYLEE